MVQASNPNFDALNKELAKNVQYLFTFSGISKKFVNKIGKISDSIPTIIGPPDPLEQKISDLKGQSSIGNVTVTMLDRKDINSKFSLTKLVSETDILGRDATLSVGYDGLDESDFLPIFTGRVGDYSSADAEYSFVLEDLLRTLIKRIFVSASKTNVITIQGNPIDLILQIMMSTGNGTNGFYDVLPSGQGLEIDQSLIDIPAFEFVRDSFMPAPDIQFIFKINKPQKAQDFLEKELFKPFNMNPFIKRDGKISILTDFPQLATVDAINFNDDTILEIPEWDAGTDRLINEIEIQMDFDEVNNRFETIVVFQDLTSVGRFNRVNDFSIKSKGLHGANSLVQDLNGDILATNIALNIFSLRSVPFPSISFPSFFFNQLSEVGDLASITNPFIPNRQLGDRGLTNEIVRITKVRTNFQRGKVELEAQLTTFSGKKFGAISPGSKVTNDETATTTVFSVRTGHLLEIGDAIQVFTEELEGQTVITNVEDSTGGGAGSNNKITVSPALARAPKIGDVVQYGEYTFTKNNTVNPKQLNYSYIGEESGVSTTIKASPTPTKVKFEVNDASIFKINDVVLVRYTEFDDTGIIFGIVGDEIQLISSSADELLLTPVGGETILPLRLTEGTIPFLIVPSLGV